MASLKQLVAYKGKRLKVRHRWLLVYWGLVIASPFLLGLVVFHWLVTWQMIQGSMDDDWNWIDFILPVVVTLSFIALGIAIPWFIIKNSIFNSGFFMKADKITTLANYLYDNDYLIRKTVKSGENGSREVLKFPPVYYHKDIDIDTVTFKIGNKYHDTFMDMGRKLEEVYTADLIEIQRMPKYISYKLLVDVISKRISFEEATLIDGKLKLMKGVVWDFERLPHMVLTGGTGGGKTYFIFMLIALFSEIGLVHIGDPKNSDLTHLGKFKAFKGKVLSDKETIMKMMNEAVESMEKRYKYMNEHPDQRMGKNYRYYGMTPEIVIVDEWADFISSLSHREEDELYKSLAPLALKGRQAGVFLIIATQRAGTDVIKSMIRDNLLCKVSLGSLSESGYEMTFGESGKNKSFFNKPKAQGRGYIDVGNGIPQEFYAPHVKPGFSFENFFENMAEMPYLDLDTVQLSDQERYAFKEQFESEKELLKSELKANQRHANQQFYKNKAFDYQQLIKDNQKVGE